MKHEKTVQTVAPVFTEEMKHTHTILIPDMLPLHFSFIEQILRQDGYKTHILKNEGPAVVEAGLKYVHNDMCYPAIIVIGQMMQALESGDFDPEKTALMITQTGGGCRASNYIHLLRKALDKAGFHKVPVISLNVSGLSPSPGFKITVPFLLKAMTAVIVGDFLMMIKNQCEPYEVHSGDTEKVIQKWQAFFLKKWETGSLTTFGYLKKYFPQILDDFAAVEKREERRPRVGIVGEIYVKYSPIGNNHLEDFLVSEGAEVVVPGLLDFCLYCVYNGVVDQKLYGGKAVKAKISKIAYHYLTKRQNSMYKIVKDHGVFRAPLGFSEKKDITEQYIGQGVKMGEGWLLTSEMAELVTEGVKNIVCTQPFGCLPNHIVAKGMQNKIKAIHPDANIVAVDYDPGASQVNQQNRIKLMLANAKMDEVEQTEEKEITVPATGGISVDL